MHFKIEYNIPFQFHINSPSEYWRMKSWWWVRSLNNLTHSPFISRLSWHTIFIVRKLGPNIFYAILKCLEKCYESVLESEPWHRPKTEISKKTNFLRSLFPIFSKKMPQMNSNLTSAITNIINVHYSKTSMLHFY